MNLVTRWPPTQASVDMWNWRMAFLWACHFWCYWSWIVSLWETSELSSALHQNYLKHLHYRLDLYLFWATLVFASSWKIFKRESVSVDRYAWLCISVSSSSFYHTAWDPPRISSAPHRTIFQNSTHLHPLLLPHCQVLFVMTNLFLNLFHLSHESFYSPSSPPVLSGSLTFSLDPLLFLLCSPPSFLHPKHGEAR